MTTESMGVDDFLEHGTRDGGRANYLGNWKKRQVAKGMKGPHVDTWLHRRAQILAIWRHPWPRVVERTPKGGTEEDGKTREVWGGSWNSWEHSSVLRKQYYLDKESGQREAPPVVCPMGRMIEAVRLAVLDGRLSWVAPMFHFEGDDPRKALILHAGGLYGAFKKSDKLEKSQLKELKDAHIFLNDAWRETMMAQCQYLFQVCDNDEPERGISIATETSLLGDKVKGVIGDAMMAAEKLGDRSKGNPLEHPYCIRWMHLPDEKVFSEKYRALKLDIPLTEEVRVVIEDDPPRDVSRDAAPGNLVDLRLSMEEHYVGPKGIFDWDEIFQPAEELAEGKAADEPKGKATPLKRAVASDAEADRQQTRNKPGSRAAVQAAADLVDEETPPEEPEFGLPLSSAPVTAGDPDDEVDCDECGGAMLASQNVCPHCGRDYSPEPPPKEEPKPVRRSRSEAGAAAKPASAEAAATSARQPPKKFEPTKATPKAEPQPARAIRGNRVPG